MDAQLQMHHLTFKKHREINHISKLDLKWLGLRDDFRAFCRNNLEKIYKIESAFTRIAA